MDIYVQSCGIAPDQDFCWRKISGQDIHKQPEEIPYFLGKEIYVKNVKSKQESIQLLTDYYDSEKPSLIWIKDNDWFILLVTALRAIERSKIYNGKLRNSIALVDTDESHLETIFNYVGDHWESFRQAIDGCVEFDDDNGFRVAYEKVKGYIDVLKPDNNEEINSYVINNILLKGQTLSTDNKGIKINIQDLEVVADFEVLSSRIREGVNETTEFIKKPQQKQQKPLQSFMIIFLSMLLTLLIVFGILFLFVFQTENQKENQPQKEETIQNNQTPNNQTKCTTEAILNYINQHPEGVTISELSEQLNESVSNLKICLNSLVFTKKITLKIDDNGRGEVYRD